MPGQLSAGQAGAWCRAGQGRPCCLSALPTAAGCAPAAAPSPPRAWAACCSRPPWPPAAAPRWARAHQRPRWALGCRPAPPAPSRPAHPPPHGAPCAGAPGASIGGLLEGVATLAGQRALAAHQDPQQGHGSGNAGEPSCALSWALPASAFGWASFFFPSQSHFLCKETSPFSIPTTNTDRPPPPPPTPPGLTSRCR